MKTNHYSQHRVLLTLKSLANTWGLYLAIPLLMLTHPMTSHAIEEPTYTVVRQIDDIEIREYAAYTVAQVVIESTQEEAGNQAFPILAAYIFGKNKGSRKLAMTAPVTQTAEPVKLEMTAPVMQTATQSGFLVRFVLPKDINVSNAPEPIDERVKILEVAPTRLAVIRYSGFWSDDNYDKHLKQLQTTLKSANLVAEGEPIYSRYNAPYTPWFMRRNEIWLRVANSK